MRSIARAVPFLVAYVVVVFLAILFSGYANGQPPLTITPSGYYITQLDADGVPSMVQITTVIDLTGGVDVPGPPSNPKVDADLVRQVQRLAGKVDDPQSAQAIAWVYLQIHDALSDGLLNASTVWVAMKQATDSALGVVATGKDWEGFRDELSDVITVARQRGTMQTSGEIALMLRSVQHGLELSADGSDALTMAQTAAITAKTNEAIDAAK